MSMMEFLGADGETLALATIADELLREGEQHGEVREFNITAKVECKGTLSRYRITAPFDRWDGEVVQGPRAFTPNVFTVDRVNVVPGQQINFVCRGLTLKDGQSTEVI
jgi:hypothetical protein